MIKNVVIDTSVWYAYYVVDDSQHEKAIELFDAYQFFDSSQMFFHLCLVEELGTTLVKKLGVEGVHYVFDELATHFNKNMILFPEQQLIRSFLNAKMKISFADIAIVMTALRSQSELITFDVQQKKVFDSWRKVYEY